jgi:hypothetical protein
LPEPFVVSSGGKLAIFIKSPTWRPHDKLGSEDQRTLGLALRLITLDRVEGPAGPHDPRH